MDEEKPMKWSCKRCTYENWPKSLKCTVCRALKHSNLIISEPHHEEERDIYKIAPLIVNSENAESKNTINNKWACSVCTYLNWPKAAKCTQCLTKRKKLSPSRSSSPNPSSNASKGNPTCIELSSPENKHIVTSDLVSSASSDNYYNDKNRSVNFASIQKWCCHACTYENWPKTTKCVLCLTPRLKSDQAGHSLSSVTDVYTEDRSNSTPSPPGAQGAPVKLSISDDITALNNNKNKETNDGGGSSTQYPNINYMEKKRLRQLRKKVREADWLWLEACCGVVNNDPEPVWQYLSNDGDPRRELTASEVNLLARPSVYDVGHTLVHLALNFQRDDLLTLMLQNSPPSIAKRVPSDVSRETHSEMRRHLANCIRQRKGEFPCYFVSEFVTFALPQEVHDLPPAVQRIMFDELLDRDVQKELEDESPIINWSIELTNRLGSRLHALWNRSTGDCLLDSALQATWGIFDKDNVLRKTLADSLSEASQVLFPRFKEAEMLHPNLLQFTLDEDQWEEDWAVILSLATQPGSALEQFHIFTLAHILRRPIIVYGVKYVKSFRGETLGYAGYEGIYLPLLWESSFCWKSPIALGYTRGHFSALIPIEPESIETRGASAPNLRNNDESDVCYLPLVTSEQKLLPLHFLSRNELGREDEIMRQWLDCCVTEGGILVAKQKVGKKPLVVAQMLEDWLNFYRNMPHVTAASLSHSSAARAYSSDGDSD